MELNNEIDIREYIKIIMKRLWVVIVFCLLFSFISGVVSKFFIERIYEAETTLYVIVKQQDDKNTLVYNDLLIGQALVKDYRELIKQKIILNQTLKELEIQNMTSSELASKVSVSLKNDTRILELKVQDKDKKRATILANKLAAVFSDKIIGIMNVESVKILDIAEEPQDPIKPNVGMNVIIAFFVGMMMGLGIIFLIEYMDNTIKTSEDINEVLGLNVIGSIPDNYKKHREVGQ